jgi:hypothetical protein
VLGIDAAFLVGHHRRPRTALQNVDTRAAKDITRSLNSMYRVDISQRYRLIRKPASLRLRNDPDFVAVSRGGPWIDSSSPST